MSTANVSRSFIEVLKGSSTIKITAVASRNLEKAQSFAEEFDIEKAYASYQELLDDPQLDAVYIPLPNSMHAEWVVKAAKAKKHILCEKPIALTVEDVKKMYEEAIKNNVFLMEGFPYKFQPQTILMLKMIQDGEIGEISQIYADFGFTVDDAENNIRLKPELGGGVMWDAGAYPVSIIRAITGQNPNEIIAFGKFNDQDLDTAVAAMLRFENGITAQLNCNFDAAPHRYVRVIGSKGIIAAGYNNMTKPNTAFIEIKKGLDWNYELEKIEVPFGSGLFFEAEAFADHIQNYTKEKQVLMMNESIDNTSTILNILDVIKK
ncbi:Gfo/Idh/MocA family oxidoreductase [Flavobacterium sp. ANB]|uniref:Gfo/Idh/MocA family protein n=1 Tax=unclassified Flavobacterium TaxID=196869 RepID=UPI00188B3A9F|nr:MULTISPECIES: Gfo/Idh/MocA family oxidoreductase [unclassified Flavobacterium]MBF4516945.1 Gfo/Idh/MocA family oxidoreductase [Flavobacterium sp. ANB]